MATYIIFLVMRPEH